MRLLFVAAEDWQFLLYRLPMARAARDAGFEVHVAAREAADRPKIENEGFVLHDVSFVRGSASPFAHIRTVRALRKLHREIRPDIVHHATLQCVVLGLAAAIGSPAASVNALTGFGYTFIADSLKARLLRRSIALLLRWRLNRPATIALVQNPDDWNELRSMGIRDEHIALIPGSGVDTDEFVATPEPAQGPVTAGFVGRLLEDKGIRTLIDAHRLLRSDGLDIELLIAGTPDPANPASVTEQEAKSWAQEPGVTWLGHVADIAGVWGRSHIAVLPSSREGFPKSLLEAAACGRPMVATDVPGCREIVIHNKTGLLVPLEDPAALAEAIALLAGSAELRAQYGGAAREFVVQKCSHRVIGRQIVALYRSLCDPAASAAGADPIRHAR